MVRWDKVEETCHSHGRNEKGGKEPARQGESHFTFTPMIPRAKPGFHSPKTLVRPSLFFFSCDLSLLAGSVLGF